MGTRYVRKTYDPSLAVPLRLNIGSDVHVMLALSSRGSVDSATRTIP